MNHRFPGKLRNVLWCTIAVLALCATAQAQWIDPFTRLDYGVSPGCPFDCDSITIWIDGELPSTNWTVPEVTGWERDGNTITVDYYTQYRPVGLPVVVPFAVDVPIGLLPEGRYEVIHRFTLDNPLATMPVIPVVVAEDTFRVAPPGDQDCDGFVNVIDLLRLIQQVFAGGPPPDPAHRADIDCDGFVNLSDIVQLVFYIFANGEICDPCDGVSTDSRVQIINVPPGVLREDPFVLQNVSVAGDDLTLVMSHSGGCMEHGYAVFMSPAVFMESAPVQANLYPVHTDPGDPCDAWVTTNVTVSLRPISELYQLFYNGPDDIVLNVHDYDGVLFEQVVYRPE
jgi:hypothetical protein